MTDAVLFSDSTFFRGKRLHLAVTGSIACYRAADLLRLFLRAGLSVSCALSPGARDFVEPLLFSALGAFPVYDHLFGATEEPFAHLEPGATASALLVAPCSANMLGKIAHGLADDIVSAQVLAFPKTLLLAPAMNPRMWSNAAVMANVELLRSRGHRIILPASGTSACGDVGCGKLAPLATLFWEGLRAVSVQDMAEKRVLVTLGPTREYWDGVRFWSNPSTGRMGAACALACWLRGASVTAICGPGVDLPLPDTIERVFVESCAEMYEETLARWQDMDYGIFTAAVADFAPERLSRAEKCAKQGMPASFAVTFQQNPDILRAAVAHKRAGQKIVAFAAETTKDQETLLVRARDKRARKGADLLAANRVNEEGSGFGTSTNRMVMVDAKGKEALWDMQSKSDVAWRIGSWLLDL